MLAIMQRQGRLIDFLHEDLRAYDDAQIGAAVRPIHEGCRQALDEHIKLEPIFSESEGNTVSVQLGFDPRAVRWTMRRSPTCAPATMRPPTPICACATTNDLARPAGACRRRDRPDHLRSRDTVERVLNRFVAGGLAAVPRRFAPGSASTLTPAWTAELLRVIELDPHTVGVDSANWTTGLRATYLAQQTGLAVSDETVRTALHAHDYVCKRPTWTLKRKAEDQPGYVGNG